jgi:hypothetical protein
MSRITASSSVSSAFLDLYRHVATLVAENTNGIPRPSPLIGVAALTLTAQDRRLPDPTGTCAGG